MNYHLMIDEKFTDGFIYDAELASNNNFYIFTLTHNPPKFIKSTKGVFADFGSSELAIIIANIKEDDKIFIHWYHDDINAFIDKIPKKTKVYLMFWGGDFLSMPWPARFNNKFNRFLYDNITYNYMKNNYKENFLAYISQEKSIKKKIKKVASEFVCYAINFYYKKKYDERVKFLNRLEGICHWNDHDVIQINKLYNTNLKMFLFCYNIGLTNFVYSKKENTVNIYLGNSDTPTNNHLDALQLLSKFKDNDIKIICPLNYENKKYAKDIANLGNKLFGDKFLPLFEYIDREKYYALLQSIDVSVMFHNRTQGAGNIIALLKGGVKVYIKSCSTICTLFKELNIHFSTEKEIEKEMFETFSKPLESKKITQNAKILDDFFLKDEIRIANLKKILA